MSVKVTIPPDRNIVVLGGDRPGEIATSLLAAAEAAGLPASVVRFFPEAGGFIVPASLVADGTPDQPEQVGDFTWTQYAPLVIGFTGLPDGAGTATDGTWDFGDGSPLGTNYLSEVHTYAAAGDYEVHYEAWYRVDAPDGPPPYLANVTKTVTVTD